MNLMYIHRRQNNLNAGFTMIEMVVAIFIMITLTFVSISNMRKGEKQKKLAFAADGLVNSLRVAQNYALSGRVLPDSATCANRSPQAYEVAFYRLSNQYTLSAVDYCGTSPSPVVETYTLPEGTILRNGGMTVCNPGCNNSEVVIVRFAPPFAKMTAATSPTGGHAPFNTVNLTVQDLNASAQRTVTIDGISGRIGE